VAGPQPQRPDAFVSYRAATASSSSGSSLRLPRMARTCGSISRTSRRARTGARGSRQGSNPRRRSSSWCRRPSSRRTCAARMRHVLRHNKRLVPVLRAEVDRDALLPELVALNWITAGDDASFDEVVAEVVEWERADRNGSFCLRGRDLGSAEAWLAAREGHREQPTDLQLAYIAASRRAARRRRFVVAAGRRRRRRVRARTVGALRRARRDDDHARLSSVRVTRARSCSRASCPPLTSCRVDSASPPAGTAGCPG
jgi:hypothetical protein